jgi:hypothetical protein
MVAVGRSLLVIIWHLLSDPDTRFHELGADAALSSARGAPGWPPQVEDASWTPDGRPGCLPRRWSAVWPPFRNLSALSPDSAKGGRIKGAFRAHQVLKGAFQGAL